MISLRVNEIFNYLSTDRKKDRSRVCNAIIDNEHREKEEIGDICEGCSNSSTHGECHLTSKNSQTWNSSDDIFSEVQKNYETVNSLCDTCQADSVSHPVKVHYSLTDTSSIDTVSSSANFTNEDSSGVTVVKDVITQRQRRRNTNSKLSVCSRNDNLTPETVAAIKTVTGCQPLSSIPTKSESLTVSLIPSPAKDGRQIQSDSSIPVKGRKKRNRRNQDRPASGTTVDFRSTSSLTNGGGSGTTTSETLNGPDQDKPCDVKSCLVLEEVLSSGLCLEGEKKNCLKHLEPSSLWTVNRGQRRNSGGEEGQCNSVQHCTVNTGRRRNSGGDEGQCNSAQHSTTQLSKAALTSKGQTTSGIADLDTFDTDLTPSTLPSASLSILDTHRIDGLDSFDEILPAPVVIHSNSGHSDEVEEWTSVSRRCKKVVLAPEVVADVCGLHGAKLAEISSTTGAHIELDMQHADRVTVVIRGTVEQIQSANSLVVALTVNAAAEQKKKKKKKKGRGGGSSSAAVGPRFNNVAAAYSVVPVATSGRPPGGAASRQLRTAELSNSNKNRVSLSVCADRRSKLAVSAADGTAVDTVTSCSSAVHPDRPSSSNSSSQTSSIPSPSSIKEYSLFDNHFSRTVEQVLRHRDSPVFTGGNCQTVTANTGVTAPLQQQQSPRYSVSSCGPAATGPINLALLAKAPGYRAMANAASSPFALPSADFGKLPYENVRKFSSSSSSSSSSIASSGKSLEECLWGTRNRPAASAPVQRPAAVTDFHGDITAAIERPHSSPQQTFSRFSPPLIGVDIGIRHGCFPADDRHHRSLPLCDFGGSSSSLLTDRDRCNVTQAVDAKPYSSPYEPMTLPRIATDLNPNAPDFVYQPPLPSSVALSTSAHCSRPLFAASSSPDPLDDYTPFGNHFHSSSFGNSNGFMSDLGLLTVGMDAAYIEDFPTSKFSDYIVQPLSPAVAMVSSLNLCRRWPMPNESVMFS